LLARGRTLAIRHVSGHRLIALLEIVSPANKDRALSVQEFVSKAVSALDVGIHLLLVDLFPPGSHDPGGMHGMIRQALDLPSESYEYPSEQSVTLASYASGHEVDIYAEHVAVA